MNALWQELSRFLSVNTIAFSVFGYPLSYLELLGTVFNVWSVWLVARNRILTWPIGLVGVGLFLVLFYQIRLYADTLEQVYYLGASVYGWWRWARTAPDQAQTFAFSPRRSLLWWALATFALGVGLGVITSNLHLWLPALFAEPASYAYLDALTTAMSFSATILMARRRIECWIYWISVDVIGIWLYAAKEVRFVALLYVMFLCLAANGLRRWWRVQA